MTTNRGDERAIWGQVCERGRVRQALVPDDDW